MINPAKKDGYHAEFSDSMKNCLATCALEGIHPDKEGLQDLKILDSGNMTPNEFIAYIIKKYQQPNV